MSSPGVASKAALRVASAMLSASLMNGKLDTTGSGENLMFCVRSGGMAEKLYPEERSHARPGLPCVTAFASRASAVVAGAAEETGCACAFHGASSSSAGSSIAPNVHGDALREAPPSSLRCRIAACARARAA